MMTERKTETRFVGRDRQSHVRTDREVNRLKNDTFRSGAESKGTHSPETAGGSHSKRKSLAAMQRELHDLKKRTERRRAETEEDGSAAAVSNKELQTAKASAEGTANFAVREAGKKRKEKQLLNAKTKKAEAGTAKKKKAGTAGKEAALLNQSKKKAEKEAAKKGAEAVASTNTVTRVAMISGKAAGAVKSFISFNWLQKAEESGTAAASNSSPMIAAVAVVLVIILSMAVFLPALPVVLASALGDEDTTPGQIGVSANKHSEGYGSKNIYNEPQCTWYCWGRVYEVYGIEMPGAGNGGEWAKNLKGTYKTYSVSEIASNPEMAVGTVVSIKGGSTVLSKLYGHCVFVEKVEDGRIYYSDWGATYKRKGISFPHTGSFSVGSSSACGGTIQGFIAPTKPAGG